MALNYTTNIQALFAANVATDANYQFGGNFPFTSAKNLGASPIASFTVTAPGTGFTSLPSIAITGGNGGGGIAGATFKVVGVPAVAVGGANYSVGNTISLGNGIVVTVATLSGNAVATVTLTSAGATPLNTIPTNPLAQVSSNGAGTGATFTVVWGINSLVPTTPGAYFTTPAVAITLGGGSGATATATLAGAATADTDTQKLLTFIELTRAYLAEMNTLNQVKDFKEILTQLEGVLKFGGKTSFSASALATKARTAMMRYLALHARSTNV